jgi:4-nitrophenyl phosphatase
MGMEEDEDRILTSAQATAVHLEVVAPRGARMFIIGEEGLRDEIQRRGFEVVDDGQAVDYVVVGMDTGLTYEKLKLGTLAIRAGAEFIGANPDKTFPTEVGLFPGNGATLAALEATTDTPPTVIGKPQPAIFQMALDRMEPRPRNPATIGDRLETDILGGQRAGMFTILLLCGVTGQRELDSSPIVPDMVYGDLAELLEAWERELEPAWRCRSTEADV